MKIEGLKKLVKSIKEMKKFTKGGSDVVTVEVGFTQNYAVYVHENLVVNHPVGQAKFLEQPAREKAEEIGQLIRETYAKTGNLHKSVLVGGLHLQRAAQLLCPVDTGALRASAYTKEIK